MGETGSTYNFGTSFKVLNVGIDDKGHVADLSEHTVTIPTIRYNATSNGNLVTALTTFAEDGEISYSKEYVGNLALTGYSNNSDTFITENTTVSNAFKAISNVLENSSDTISARITSRLAQLTASKNAGDGSASGNVEPMSVVNAISGITQENGLITNVSSVLVDQAGAAAAALGEARDYADDKASTAEQNAKTYADTKAATAEQNAKDYVSTATFSYTTTPTLNPDYNSEDPESEEYLPGTTTTKTIEQ